MEKPFYLDHSKSITPQVCKIIENGGGELTQVILNPEVYLNLARVYLHFGFKTEGRRFLLRGQMIDPANAEISGALEGLGARLDPVLRFLPRRHFINRWLGSARHLIGAGEGEQIAA